ncbi:MAG: glycosyltransferase [Saprospiraceae bacterium]
MYFKVLHILDYYLPETMQWIEDLFNLSEESVQHHVASLYYKKEKIKFPIVSNFGIVTTYPIPIFNKISNIVRFSYYEDRLFEYIKENRIDAVHFHFGNMAIKFDKVLMQLKCLTFISLYGYDYEYLPVNKPETLEFYRKFASHGTKFVVEGSYSKKLLVSYGIPLSQICIVQMLYNRSFTLDLKEWKKPINLLQVASYSEKKGQLILIEALAKSSCSKEFKLDFYGEIVNPHYFKELSKCITRNKLKNIKLNDKLSFPNYISKLKNSHMVVNLSNKSSLSDTEGGCPVFLKDALSLGKPLLTTSHCDIPDIAINNYNAWIVNEKDVKATSNAIQEIERLNARTYLKYCRNAFQSAFSKTNSNWTLNCLINAYKD